MLKTFSVKTALNLRFMSFKDNQSNIPKKKQEHRKIYVQKKYNRELVRMQEDD